MTPASLQNTWQKMSKCIEYEGTSELEVTLAATTKKVNKAMKQKCDFYDSSSVTNMYFIIISSVIIRGVCNLKMWFCFRLKSPSFVFKLMLSNTLIEMPCTFIDTTVKKFQESS
jgi:hypothetical protein